MVVGWCKCNMVMISYVVECYEIYLQMLWMYEWEGFLKLICSVGNIWFYDELML